MVVTSIKEHLIAMEIRERLPDLLIWHRISIGTQQKQSMYSAVLVRYVLTVMPLPRWKRISTAQLGIIEKIEEPC